MSGTIGVLGGLGPWATLDFFEKVLRLTPARCDQEHLHVIIDNNPRVPERTAAILGRGEDPTPALVAGARRLEAAGADLIAIPCNTAHAFYEPIQAAVGVPVLHIMREVARTLSQTHPSARRVGLLATEATVAARLYEEACEPLGLEILVPAGERQAAIDRLIAAIKEGEAGGAGRAEGEAVGRALVRDGATVVILGCTELPLALMGANLGAPVLDSNFTLATAAVRLALAKTLAPAGGLG